MSSPLRLIGLSQDDICHEEDFLEWLKSYRDDTDSARICQNPELHAALSSDFPFGLPRANTPTRTAIQCDCIQSTYLFVPNK
jgi:hypothetical protein